MDLRKDLKIRETPIPLKNLRPTDFARLPDAAFVASLSETFQRKLFDPTVRCSLYAFVQ